MQMMTLKCGACAAGAAASDEALSRATGCGGMVPPTSSLFPQPASSNATVLMQSNDFTNLPVMIIPPFLYIIFFP
jgi:hypothetical protein